MKKLQQKLLSSYPMIWNTRIYILLPVLLLLHLFYFLSGFAQDFSIRDVSYSISEPGAESVFFAILLGILIGILWLVFYLRNNALKSLYPSDKSKLFGEYLCILIICIGLTSLIESYRWGAYAKFKTAFLMYNTKEDAETVNMASAFLPFDLNDFQAGSSCDFVNSEGTTTTSANNYNTTDSVAVSDNLSYLNYCQVRIADSYTDGSTYNETQNTIRRIHTTANRWLKENKQDSVRYILKKYIALCDKYHVSYRFDVNAHVKRLFQSDKFLVTGQRLSNTSSSFGSNGEFIENYRLESVINNISYARHRHVEKGLGLFFLYFGLCMSVTIFSFRITRTRSWFIALVGVPIWGIIFGLLGAGARSGNAMIFLFIFLAFLFIIHAAWNINTNSGKSFSGVSFNWFLWMLPGILPFICLYIASGERSSYVYDNSPNPLVRWINNHWILIGYTNLLITVLVIFMVIIPLARKWQSNAEE